MHKRTLQFLHEKGEVAIGARSKLCHSNFDARSEVVRGRKQLAKHRRIQGGTLGVRPPFRGKHLVDYIGNH